MAPLRIKICGLTRRTDAEVAVALGASYLGTVLVPSSPRCVSPETARTLTEGLGIPGVAVVANLEVMEVLSAARRAGAEVIQLHGEEPPDVARRIRAEGPWRVWKAVRVSDATRLEASVEGYLGAVDGLLLDGWDPERLGGTGRPFDWEGAAPLLQGLRKDVELIVAGGLTPENLERAVSLLDPDTLDVSSGVESEPGVKDHGILRTFFEKAKLTRDPSDGATS